jgi:hypothetical protein
MLGPNVESNTDASLRGFARRGSLARYVRWTLLNPQNADGLTFRP